MSDKKKVLFVSNDQLTRASITRMLERDGHECISTVSAEEGMDIVLDIRPDVVVTEYNVGRINGYDFAHSVREVLPLTKFILAGPAPNKAAEYISLFPKTVFDRVLSRGYGAEDMVGHVRDVLNMNVTLCSDCSQEYDGQKRTDVGYRSGSLGKYGVWYFKEPNHRKIPLSHGMCPDHYKAIHDAIGRLL